MKKQLCLLLAGIAAHAVAAEEINTRAVCICFDPADITILHPESPPSIDPAREPRWSITPVGDAGFETTRQAPSLKIPINVPAGRYRRVSFHLEVARGPWRAPADALRNFLWLVKRSKRGKPENRFMLFYVNVRGPERDLLMLRHGWGTRHRDKVKEERRFEMQEGRFYTIEGDFDLATGLVVLRLGDVEIRSPMKNARGVEVLEIEPGEGIHAELGFDGSQEGEVPFEGTYRNFRLSFYE